MEKQTIILIGMSLVIGFALGILIPGQGNVDETIDHAKMQDQENHEGHEMEHDMTDHDHAAVEVTENAPSIDLIIHEDAKSGWNLELVTQNFEFAPENANKENQDQQGHAHLYVNGEKITRLYSNWYYLGPLEAGEHEVQVTLNTNMHEDFLVDGEHVQDTETITVE